MAIKRHTSATPARAGEKSQKVARGRSARPASRDSGGSLPDPGLNVAQNGEKLQKVLARGRSRHPASRAVQGSTNVAGSRMRRATDTGTSLYGAGSKVGPGGEKVQKVLARAGVGSRREMERWIEQARITIDGQPAKIGDRVRPGQRLRIDGRELPHTSLAPKPRVLIYHKPEGEITTRNDPQGRATVFDNLPQIRQGRWIAIGRLDLNSSGLLMFTTDGELANRLMHPSAEIEREYAVRILGAVPADAIGRLTTGVALEDGPARFENVIDAGGTGANHWYHVVIREGRNREVRRMWEAVGATVSRLIRVRYGPVTLPRLLRPGRSVYLEREELEGLYAAARLSSPTPERHKSATGRRGRPPRGAVRRRAGKR